ncbi:MAG: hypothetical protein ACRDTT_12950 [Pseudonocardiaceae bacterium]
MTLNTTDDAVSENARLHRALASLRMRHANLLAAARATLTAARDGETNPLAYLVDELAARLRSEGMAPDGAVLVTGARHSPGISSQVGTQPSPTRALFAFTQVDGTGRSDPAAASPMGRPMVSAGDEVSASLLAGFATASDMGLYRRAGCLPSATEGVAAERGTRARHRQLSIGVPQAPSVINNNGTPFRATVAGTLSGGAL